MNYLGHAVYSVESDAVTLGNLAGDFLKNKFHSQLDAEVLRGVMLHREIDSITDRNTHFREMIGPLRKDFGKYSGVVLDILLDYLIAESWGMLFETDFEGFTNEIYRGIIRENDRLPPEQSNAIGRMAESRWLDVYKSERGLINVFKRLSQKASREISGEEVLKVFREQENWYNQKLLAFLESNRNSLRDNPLWINPRIEWKS
jgi:acyl carrier protein phosphodiesterase